MAQLWNADVANAVAHRLSMPGVEGLQRQFVRYQGQVGATQTQAGWLRPESDTAMQHALADPLTPQQPPLTAALPQQVQLSIKSAPADFCLPIKKLKRFKPSFQVELRVVHSGAVRLPVRVKAFVVHKWQMDRVHEWLPEELQDDEDLKHTKSSDRKGRLQDGRVLSCLVTDTPQPPRPPRRRNHSGGSGGGGASGGRARPAFPARASLDSAAVAPRLSSDASLISEISDPTDDATLLHVTDSAILAEFDFAALKFEEPTNMKPVHIAFACLVGNRDLLYSVYSVPCIAVCRAEQRDGARRRLGLPPTVWADLGIACPSVVMPGPRRPVPTPLSTQKRSPAAADEQAPAEGAEAAQAPTMHQLWDEFAKQLPVATEVAKAEGSAAEVATGNCDHPPCTADVVTPLSPLVAPPALPVGSNANADASVQPCLFSSATLDAIVRGGSLAPAWGPSAQQSSFENFWSLLQQRDASFTELSLGALAGGSASAQPGQLDGDTRGLFVPPPAERAPQAADAFLHSGLTCGAETRHHEGCAYAEMRRERSRDGMVPHHD